MSGIVEPDLNDIRVFLEVVDQGSFTAAGKNLELPTSTVSRRISRLEGQLGARLLQRTTRKLSLTDAGRIYYQRSERALLALEDARQAVSEMQATPRGTIRMTAPIEMDQLTGVLTDFLELYPEVQVSLDLTNRYVDLIEEGYDLAIRAGELSDSSLVAKQLATTEFVLVASPDYLKARGTPKRIDDLRDHACLVGGAQSLQAVWRLCNKDKIVPIPVSGRLSANHLGVLLRAARRGLGITRLPAGHCAAAIADGSLVEVLPGACPSMGKVSAVYPSREFMNPAVRALIDHLVEALQVSGSPDDFQF
jgi:DNA-binding transcriptional LysR family regulator